jgi:hypothetical protein
LTSFERWQRSQPDQIRLIIEADEPALFYASLQDAQLDLEPIDVKAGVYKSVYGRDGQVYEINVKNNKVLFDFVSGKRDVDTLKKVIKTFLVSIDGHFEETESLASLLTRCEPYVQRVNSVDTS